MSIVKRKQLAKTVTIIEKTSSEDDAENDNSRLCSLSFVKDRKHIVKIMIT